MNQNLSPAQFGSMFEPPMTSEPDYSEATELFGDEDAL